MTTTTPPRRSLFIMSIVNLAIAIAAAAIATSAMVSALAAEQRAYDRIVAETAEAFRPVYRDFGLNEPPTPRTIGEALAPMLAPVTRLSP